MFMLKSKQQGFTLLELLVVITLLAVLAVGALVAYEDVGENAEAAAAANANVTLDSAIRTYRAVEKAYPNQWDSLVTLAGSAIPTLPSASSAVFGSIVLSGAAADAAAAPLLAVGIDEIQYINDSTASTIAPNRQHNESVNANAQEVGIDGAGAFANVSIVPSGGAAGTCTFNGVSLNAAFNAVPLAASGALGANTIQNKFNDSLESDECHLVVALGFGGDAAASTTNSKVAISQAPTYTKTNVVNPATNYARYIGLFHVAADDEDVPNTAKALAKARLVAVITPDGKVIDDAIADAQTTTN
jgi:prepilin-type N-terminal cleavage/methylation domain-containing protein